MKNDLRHIIKSDEFFEFISQVDSFESKTRFIWKVEQFPYSDNADNTDLVDVYDTAGMVDTVLAIAKTAELCAVISMTDKHDIWYRLYENTATYEGFGTLRYAYIQHFFFYHGDPFAVNAPGCESIFILYNEHPHDIYSSIRIDDIMEDHTFKIIKVESQFHEFTDDEDHNGAALVKHKFSIKETDDRDHPFEFSFKNRKSQRHYENDNMVNGYGHFITYRPEDQENEFRFGRTPFLRDCLRRPDGLITWEVNTTQDALITSIVRSFMCQIK